VAGQEQEGRGGVYTVGRVNIACARLYREGMRGRILLIGWGTVLEERNQSLLDALPSLYN